MHACTPSKRPALTTRRLLHLEQFYARGHRNTVLRFTNLLLQKKKTWSRFKMLPCYQRHTPTAFGQIPLYLEFPWKPRNKTLNLEKIKQAFRYNAKQLIATFPPEQRREILPQKKENKSVETFKPNQDTQPSNHCTRIASCCTQLHQLPRLFLAGESRNVCTIRCHCLTNSLLEAAISMQPSGSKLFQPRGLAQRRTIRLLN